MDKFQKQQPAFPGAKWQNHANDDSELITYTAGLTKREWFAGMALQGLLSNPQLKRDLELEKSAVHIADCMMDELSK